MNNPNEVRQTGESQVGDAESGLAMLVYSTRAVDEIDQPVLDLPSNGPFSDCQSPHRVLLVLPGSPAATLGLVSTVAPSLRGPDSATLLILRRRPVLPGGSVMRKTAGTYSVDIGGRNIIKKWGSWCGR